MTSLISEKTAVRVSSVLNKDVKQFGKAHMFDGKEDTCWNSDQGLPQFILIDFPKPTVTQELELRFQGGFVGQSCHLERFTNTKWEQFADIFPEDTNSLQHFSINCQEPLTKMKIVFLKSSDFYGRVTIYHLDIKGHESEN